MAKWNAKRRKAARQQILTLYRLLGFVESHMAQEGIWIGLASEMAKTKGDEEIPFELCKARKLIREARTYINYWLTEEPKKL